MSSSDRETAYAAVRVGVGVVVRRAGMLLVGLRQGSHGPGEWSLPGGGMELWESPETCAEREVREETGVRIENVRRIPLWTEDRFPDFGRHFITLYLTADWAGGEAERLEPHKCLEWRWVRPEEIPEPMFCGLGELVARYGPKLACAAPDR